MARAAVVACLSGIGLAHRKFERGQTAVKIQLFPFGETGSLPTSSMPKGMKWTFVKSDLHEIMMLISGFEKDTFRASLYPVSDVFRHVSPAEVIG